MVEQQRTSGAVPLILGPWTIDIAARTITGANGTRRLEPKPMAIIAYLAERIGTVVSRQELLNAAWPGESATDDVLSRAISELRRALDDDPRNPSSLLTIRGSGYRLVVPGTAAPIADRETRVEARAAEGERNDLRLNLLAGLTVAAGAIVSIATIVAIARPSARAERSDPHLIPLSADPGEEMNPRVSPDGSRIVSIHRDSGGEGWVVVRMADGSAPTRIARTSARSAAWSPDGSRIAFVSSVEAGQAIAVAPTLGGPPTIVTRLKNPTVLGVDWSSDGTRIAFSTHDMPFAPFVIETVSLESLVIDTLTSATGASVGDAFPSYSPDGRTLAFARFATETAGDVYVVDVRTRQTRRVTFDERNVTGLAYGLRGDSLLFASDRDGGSAVWQVPVRGGPATRVVGSDLHVGGIGVSRKDGAVIVAGAEVTEQLRVFEPRKHTRILIPTSRGDRFPAISPDAKRVAFVSDRGGSDDIWLVSMRGDSLAQITTGGGYASVPSWSADGSKLLVGRRVSGANEIWMVDVARRRSERAHVGLRTPILPSWSADGQSIILSSNESGAWEIWRVPLEGTPVRLTTHGGIRGLESPNGTLAFTKVNAAGLWLRQADGVESLVEQRVVAGDWANWAFAGDSLVFVDRAPSGFQEIALTQTPNGRATVLVDSVETPVAAGGVSVSRDGAVVIYANVDRRSGHLYRVAPRRPRE